MSRYEILDDLPPTGVVYITSAARHTPVSEEVVDLIVRFFKKDGTSWVANFEAGTGLDDVAELSGTGNLFVMAGGKCYIMNPDEQVPLSEFGGDYYHEINNSDGRIILFGKTNLAVVETNGQHWLSEKIASGGFLDIHIEKNIVTGLTIDELLGEDKGLPFSYDIDNRVLNGGIYKEFKKPWWKFW